MSKGKDRNKNKGEGGSVAAAGSASGGRKPRVQRSFVERLVDKAETIFTKASEVALMSEKRGVPTATVTIAKEFVTLTEKYREAFYLLRASAWTPPAKASSIPIAAGAKVAIAPANVATYNYIPGVTDNTARLVVTAVLQQGKRVQVLVTTEEGQPCGYIPRSHLVLR